MYQEWAPPEDLAPFVRCLWSATYSADGPGHTVLPDGCIDVLFAHGEVPRAIVAGAMTAPLHVSPERTRIVAARFAPGCARAFLRDDAVHFTDAVVDIADARRDGAIFAERFAATAPPRQAVLLVDYLRSAFVDADVDANVRAAVERLTRPARVGDVSTALGLTRQTLARTFRRHVGLTPKAFGRIMRMQRSVSALRRGGAPLAEIALGCGYADEAHLANEMRRLTGTSPNAFRRAACA